MSPEIKEKIDQSKDILSPEKNDFKNLKEETLSNISLVSKMKNLLFSFKESLLKKNDLGEQPEKKSMDITELISLLHIEKENMEKKIVSEYKHDLDIFKKWVGIPDYYNDYAKKWSVEFLKSSAALSLYQHVSDSKNDSNIIARWMWFIAEKLLS